MKSSDRPGAGGFHWESPITVYHSTSVRPDSTVLPPVQSPRRPSPRQPSRRTVATTPVSPARRPRTGPLSGLLLAAAMVALGACTSAPPSGNGASPTELLTRAETAEAQGDITEAARLYRQLATINRGGLRADYLLSAARLWISTGNFTAAAADLTAAQDIATPAQRIEYTVLMARLDVEAGRADGALTRLDTTGPIADPALASLAAETRGLALFALNRPAEAVTVFVEREIWLNSTEEILANQRHIWDGLATLNATPGPAADETIAGWLALAPLTRLEFDPPGFRAALLDWRTRYGTHPAASGILADIIASHRGTMTFPQRIALLLPLGSTRRIQAQAVRDGFLAARIADPEATDTIVTVYDTAAAGVTDAYVRAQTDGADFVVGPLLPEAVEQIVPMAGFVPTLALNFSPNDQQIFPQSLFQFALAPEDEARAIAEHAIAEGQRRAVALFASTDRGYRLMAAFQAAFESLGGEVLAASAYVPESQDASGPITQILNIAASEQRHRRLQANLASP